MATFVVNFIGSTRRVATLDCANATTDASIRTTISRALIEEPRAYYSNFTAQAIAARLPNDLGLPTGLQIEKLAHTG